MPDVFNHDPRTGTYRNLTTGRLISNAEVRAVVDVLADNSAVYAHALTQALQGDQITLADWQTRMMANIKASHVASGVAAHGGRGAMTPADWGYIGHEIRDQYAYLRNFANGIAAGTVPLDGQLPVRAAMYGSHSRVMFELVRARDDASRGYNEERNVLHADESCPECSELKARGWVPLGTLPPIGMRRCLSNCKCMIARRASPLARGLRRVV